MDRPQCPPSHRGAWAGMDEDEEEEEEEEGGEGGEGGGGKPRGCQCLGRDKVPALGDHWPASVLVQRDIARGWDYGRSSRLSGG